MRKWTSGATLAIALCTAMAFPGAIEVLHGAVSLPRSPQTESPLSGRTVVIDAGDFAYSRIPARMPAGWLAIRMVNTGRELHMLATVNVPHGFTSASLIDSLVHERHVPELVEWGGPNAVAPRDTNTVTLFLPAGDYVVGCFEESADGKPHFVKGMVGSFSVVASPDAGTPPSSDAVATLSSYHIAMSGAPFTSGTHTLLVRNVAADRHDFVILKVLPGHSVEDALHWIESPATGKAAAQPVGGSTGIHPGEQIYVRATFTPGTYVLVCRLTTKNKPHFRMGMRQVITVRT